MGINKPFHRNYRGMVQGPNSGHSDGAYISDPKYANSPQHYIRAFLLIQSDLQKLFEYIEPSDEGLKAFSYRIHELFMRTCIEIEANFKAILRENKYTPEKDKYKHSIYNMNIYKKINVTHHLAAYQVSLPIWNGERKPFAPFQRWSEDKSLPWYSAYNASKHDRQDKFKKANLENLLEAVAGLLILLSSQFRRNDFSPTLPRLLISPGDPNGFNEAIGQFFEIKFPDNWKDEEKYEFNWSVLKNEEHRFDKYNYDTMQLEISDE